MISRSVNSSITPSESDADDKSEALLDGLYQLRPGLPLSMEYNPTKNRGKDNANPPLESFQLIVNVEDVALLYGVVAHIGDETTPEVKVVISFFLPESENLRNKCGILLKPNARHDFHDMLADMSSGQERDRLEEWATEHLCFESFLLGRAARELSTELDTTEMEGDFCRGAYDEGIRGRVHSMYHEDEQE